ncbi:MAG: shikimate dehydrogenase, partial [Candidatus Omnitrophica bacterium]|nr:shikimate dehydrogenase [Candidatus Omnitrophota bacterium]
MTIKKKTGLYGVIGYPITHTLSPAMHNAAFRKLGINAVYMPLEVRPENLKEAMDGIKGLGFGGVNVTIPHKEAVIKYLDRLSKEAALIGAVNTIVNKNGTLTGYNTDAYGFTAALKEDLGFTPTEKTVFVVGAGGAAKAVVFALILGGASRVIITDKADEKALELACEAELKTGCECIALKMGSPGMKEMIL